MYVGSNSASIHQVLSILQVTVEFALGYKCRAMIRYGRSTEAESDSPNFFYHQKLPSSEHEKPSIHKPCRTAHDLVCGKGGFMALWIAGCGI